MKESVSTTRPNNLNTCTHRALPAGLETNDDSMFWWQNTGAVTYNTVKNDLLTYPPHDYIQERKQPPFKVSLWEFAEADPVPWTWTLSLFLSVILWPSNPFLYNPTENQVRRSKLSTLFSPLTEHCTYPICTQCCIGQSHERGRTSAGFGLSLEAIRAWSAAIPLNKAFFVILN